MKFCHLFSSEHDSRLISTGASRFCWKLKEGHAALIWESDSLAALADDVVSFAQAYPCGNGSFVMEFVPPEIEAELAARGFRVRCEWCDAWKRDLSGVTPAPPPEGWLLEECRHAARDLVRVTQSCARLSRGFDGETDATISEWLSDEHHTAFLARTPEGEAAAMSLVGLYGFEKERGPVLWVREIAVAPRFQRRGLARFLVRHALSHGVKRGATRSFLAVDAENHPMRALAESEGFVFVSGRGEIVMASPTVDFVPGDIE